MAQTELFRQGLAELKAGRFAEAKKLFAENEEKTGTTAHLLDDASLHGPAYDTGMPELPELEALVEALEPLVTRSPVRDVPVAHFAVVKTATPPLDWLAGHRLTGAVRRGKHRPEPCSRCTSRTAASSS